jgi:hypothetical protein
MDFIGDRVKAASLCGDDVEDGINTVLPSRLRLLPAIVLYHFVCLGVVALFLVRPARADRADDGSIGHNKPLTVAHELIA